MALMSGVDLPAAHIRNQVAAALDVVVHLARLRDGRRIVWEISSIEGTRRGEPVVTPLFSYTSRADASVFEASGEIPAVIAKLAERGEEFGPDLFQAGADG
jgi:pilus assembly protein CpaF